MRNGTVDNQAEFGQQRPYGQVSISGRPLAGLSQGQNQTVAKLLR
jgi:hypothetical protein